MNTNIRPPRWAEWLLSHFSPAGLEDELQGDLLEMYAYWVKTIGVSSARWRYGLAVLRLIRPLTTSTTRQPNDYSHPFMLHPAMIRNYLKIAFRNLARHKAYSSINLLGLGLGLTCSLLILLWVQDEFRMDRFHTNAERIFLVMQNQDGGEKGISTSAGTPSLLAQNLIKDFGEVDQAVVLTFEETTLLTAGSTFGKEKGRYASKEFLSIFSFPLLQGDARTALGRPDAIVISRKLAQKYFPGQNPLGRLIRVDNTDDLLVTAVLDDMPPNSSLSFDYLLSWNRFLTQHEWARRWDNNAFLTYVLLTQQANPASLTAKIKDYLKIKTNNERWAVNTEFFLQKNSDAYLYSKFKNGVPDGGRIEYVRLFGLVAIFILLIACINFMNLATARSAKRAREVGVRKAVGATRQSLMGQFISESLLITFLSLLLAVVMVVVLLPLFNQITGKQLQLPFSINAVLIGVSITVFTGLLAGSYPALFLSSLKPVTVLKGVLLIKPGASLFRQSLVVFQFSLSTLLIVGMITVYRQIHYLQTKNLGFAKENLVYMPLEGDLKKNYPAFRNELLRQPGVKSVACSWADPLQANNSTSGISWRGKDTTQLIRFSYTAVDYDYLRTMGIQLVAGRDFSPAYGTDTTNYIINEEAARKLGYKNPIGQELTFWGNKGMIVGVMKNYHINSLHVAIDPLILRMQRREYAGVVLVRVEAGQTQAALASTEETFRKFNPGYPFDYRFTDQEFGRFYKTELIIGKLTNYFAFLAIFISCLGLFGLATFTAEQRTKEIGVRKALGASVSSIIALLSRDFLKLVLIALLLASPIAWWVMSQWLQGFAYRIPIEWWMFALAGLLAIGIALLTVSFQSIKAALVNPVKSLRSE